MNTAEQYGHIVALAKSLATPGTPRHQVTAELDDTVSALVADPALVPPSVTALRIAFDDDTTPNMPSDRNPFFQATLAGATLGILVREGADDESQRETTTGLYLAGLVETVAANSPTRPGQIRRLVRHALVEAIEPFEDDFTPPAVAELSYLQAVLDCSGVGTLVTAYADLQRRARAVQCCGEDVYSLYEAHFGPSSQL